MKINLHTSHPSAFISSTFIDLKKEREAVAQVLKDSNLNINALDVKPASNISSKKEIMEGIKESDFIILIIGERYGSIIQKMTASPKLSITRWEYDRAVGFGKPVLVYFKNINSNNDVHYDDKLSADFEIKRKYLKEFKKELSEKHNPKYFTTHDELIAEIRKAIIPTYRNGVKSLIRENELYAKELKTLRLENQQLRLSPPALKPVFENEVPGLLGRLMGGKKIRGLTARTDDDQEHKKPSKGLGLINRNTISDKTE